MEKTGATAPARKIDDLGRVVIAKDILQLLGWGKGTELVFVDVDTEAKSVTMRQASPNCIFCGNGEGRIIAYKGRCFCQECITVLKRTEYI